MKHNDDAPHLPYIHVSMIQIKLCLLQNSYCTASWTTIAACSPTAQC